jgi:CRP-like cAMP-binding protein
MLDTGLTEFLRGVFACSPAVAEGIATRGKLRSFHQGMAILRQGEPASATHLVVTGLTQAVFYGRDGHSLLVSEYGPCDMFGALADVGPASLDADVIAVEPVKSLSFLPLDFLALMDSHACVGAAVSRMLSRRLRQTTARMAEQSTLSATGRVHAELVRLVRQNESLVLRPSPVLTSLATRVNTTRETVSRAITALERRGIVRREADALVVVALHRLEALIV